MQGGSGTTGDAWGHLVQGSPRLMTGLGWVWWGAPDPHFGVPGAGRWRTGVGTEHSLQKQSQQRRWGGTTREGGDPCEDSC